MMPISIKVRGLDQVHKSLSQDVKPIVTNGFRLVAEIVRKEGALAAPYNKGKLSKGIRKIPSGKFGWHIIETSKHGLWIREGTWDHFIEPRKAKALWWPGLPHPIAWALHPGIRQPNDYPARGVANATADIQAEVEAMAVAVARKMG